MKAILAGLMMLAMSSSASAQRDADAPFRAYDAGRYAEALEGATAALEHEPDNPVWWALVGEAQAKFDHHESSAEAFATSADLDPDPARRSYLRRAQAYQLVLAGRVEAARSVVVAALADSRLDVRTSLDWAMVAIAAGDDAAAQDILGNEALHGEMTRQSALDAAYSAKRRGLDRRAVRFFARGLALDEGEADPLPVSQRDGIRRETRELGRNWSFLAQGAYSGAGRPIGPASLAPDNEELLQVGGEAALRIGGWRNGRPLSVFARVFNAQFLTGDAQGDGTTQAWVGLRYKPLSQINLNLEASRMIAIDADAIDDWSFRAALSGGIGLEPESGQRGWLYAHYYADGSYLTEADVTFGLAEGRAGYALLIDRKTGVLTPYVVARFDIDTGRLEQEALGSGVGLSLRHWFDETEMTAWRGFVELDLQLRQRIAGDERASGMLATLTVGR